MSSDNLLFSLLYTTLFIGFTSLSSRAQEINLNQFYSSMESHNSLKISSSERIDSLYVAYLKEHEIENDNGSYQEFIYDYNFFLEKLNKSGKVFSGDELSIYLNDLKNEILVNHPKKESIKVYLTNFDQLNAFTNDFGSIYVNIATIAKIDSEMKLRVIIAHEIAHVLMSHSFKMANLDNHFSNDKFERINQVSDFDSHQFSQKQELEADSIAYRLLSDIGYDLSNLGDLFEDLSKSRNPVFSDEIHLSDLCLSDDTIQRKYLTGIVSSLKTQELFKNTIEDDSLSTHPSAEARKLLYEKFEGSVLDSSITKSSLTNKKFSEYRLLAANVLARTLMTEHKYIEGLYLVLQLRTKYPNNVELEKLFLKLQVLISQSKYMYNETPILNEYGGSCDNINYLTFRRGLLSIPALEMNIITISNIQISQVDSEDDYYSRLLDFSLQFLYKYNPKLITKKNGELALSNNNILSVNSTEHSDDVNSLNLKKHPLLNSNEKKLYKEMSDKGYIVIENVLRGKSMISAFTTNFTQYDELKKSLYNYRETRDQFEKMLTIDEFVVDFNPDESYMEYRKGKVNKVSVIPDSAMTALVQTDTYVFTRQKGNAVTMDSKKTLEIHTLINNVLEADNYVSMDLTNLNQTKDKISVRDNHMHYLLTNWIGECLNFEDLVYSVADEEIMEYFESLNTEYLVYNFNLLNKSQSHSNYRCLYYNLYFDLKTMGVAYVSVIASRKKPKKKYLKHYFYQAHFGKSSL